MRAGPSAATKFATSASTMPAPAAIVSFACEDGAVVAADGGGDPALCPAGRGTLAERRGGQHGDRQRRQLQRREQAGEARTDDDHIAAGAETLIGRRAEAAVVQDVDFMCHQIPRRGLHRPAGGSLRRRVISW